MVFVLKALDGALSGLSTNDWCDILFPSYWVLILGSQIGEEVVEISSSGS